VASYRKNPNGTYTATVYVGRDASGKMIREYVTRGGLKETKEAARELEKDVAAKDLSAVSKMKMSDYMDRWLGINRPHLASTTVKSYKGYIENHFKPWFKRKRVNQINDLHIKAYIADKLTEDSLSPTTVRKHFFVLQKMFREAIKHKSPCIGVKPPQPGSFKPVIPTEKQFKAIREAFAGQGPEYEAAILLAGWCGLRRGEVFALRWDDINAEKGCIRVDEALALVEDRYAFEAKEPKSSKGVRVIVAPDALFKLLDKIKAAQKQIRHEVFTINPDQFTKRYNKIIGELSLKIRYHDLRHYHASVLYKNKVPDIYAAERLGHDIWVLKKIYQHLGLEDKNKIDKKVKGLFK
jgi:integrase